MYTLCSKIKIGNNTYNGINEVEITRSIDSISATAKIKVPQTAVRIVDGKLFRTQTRINIVEEVKPGDEVFIQLGYNGVYFNEFKGYVKQIDYRTPLVIECEDEFYKCRQKYIRISGEYEKNESSETGESTNISTKVRLTLWELLKRCGFQVGYAVPLTFHSLSAGTKSIAKLLDEIKREYGLVIFFDVENKIYAGNIYQMIKELNDKKDLKSVGATVNYRFRYNIIQDTNFTKREQSDTVKFKGTIIGIDGRLITLEKGNGDDKTATKVTFYHIDSEEELKALVEEGYRRLNEGWEGKFETFLLPYSNPGMVANIMDPVYGLRNGEFIIKKVTTKYNSQGGRRTIEIGEKIWEV